MKAKEFMITDVIVGHPQDTIGEVLTTFVERKIGGVPIVNDKGVLVGVVSDGDLLRSIKPKQAHVIGDMWVALFIEDEELKPILERMKDVPVFDICRKKRIIMVQEDDEMEQIVRIFAENHFKKLPVVDKEQKVVGLISRGDVLRHIQQTLLKQF